MVSFTICNAGLANIPTAENKVFVDQIDAPEMVIDMVAESQFADNEKLITLNYQATNIVDTTELSLIESPNILGSIKLYSKNILKKTSNLGNYLIKPGWRSSNKNIQIN